MTVQENNVCFIFRFSVFLRLEITVNFIFFCEKKLRVVFLSFPILIFCTISVSLLSALCFSGTRFSLNFNFYIPVPVSPYCFLYRAWFSSYL
jgi:hypothetical protein